VKHCGNCGAAHNTEYKSCESCRRQWREDKPSKRTENKQRIDSIIQELSLIHGASRVINKLTDLREAL